MSRSLNLAQVLGNLTRDPELKYTPQGNAVATFSVATNRQWTTEDGQTREEVEFHNVVAWNKLAELCSQLLKKGSKTYVSGRLRTRTWDDAQGMKHYRTEIIADDMINLTPRAEGSVSAAVPEVKKEKPVEKAVEPAPDKGGSAPSEDVPAKEMPF